MKWIKKIIDVFPYTVICLWNDDLIRTTDLTEFLMEKSKNPKNSYAQLLEKARFMEVQCDGTTIFWDAGIKIFDIDNTPKPAPLDIDPDVLFRMSTLNPEYLTKVEYSR